MNSKKANRIFLVIVLAHIFIVFLGMVIPGFLEMNMISNLILSQLIVLVPAFTGVLLSGEKISVLIELRRIKFSSVLMILLFTVLMTPLITLVNSISLLFVDNAVNAVSGDILAVPFPLMVLFIGIVGPLSEEVVFRGLFYNSYKKSGKIVGAIAMSALLFGLMHMNFNQAAYAIVVGTVLVLVNEAAGSILASIIFHIVFNTQQVCLMYLVDEISPERVAAASEQMDRQLLMAAIGIYIVIASVTTTLAGVVLVWIAKKEKHEGNLRAIWTGRKTKATERLITIPFIVAVVLCLIYMTLMSVFSSL